MISEAELIVRTTLVRVLIPERCPIGCLGNGILSPFVLVEDEGSVFVLAWPTGSYWLATAVAHV